MNTALLGVFAKQPIAGEVKTRLAEATSPEWAQRVAQAFLEDTLERFRSCRAECALVYAPSTAGPYFATIARNQYDLIPQMEGDLGQRLAAFFGQARARGCSRIVAIAADSPTLPVEWVDQSFRMLETHDVVIGPAHDGGYYLIGTRAECSSLFESIPWSTARVLETTVERLHDAQATLALLPPWYDVDTADDWALLRGHVLAMRRAGLDPGVPGIERLIMETTR